MKIRIQKGSLRFRLRRTDVSALLTSGRVEESVALGDSQFSVVLMSHGAPAMARVEPCAIVAGIPSSEVQRWADQDLVGIYFELDGGTRLMIEKDWACLEPVPGESNEDTFSRPGPVR